MIADDDADDIDIFLSAAKEECPEMKVTVAWNGQELLDILHQSPKPDAIILDMNMPLKNGYECLREIRQKDKYNDIPVMMFSTSNKKTDVEKCLSTGANHYVVKPDNYNDFRNIAKKICTGAFPE